jgi:hypothetical protein
MAADIWVPENPPDQITIDVDETYFDQNSGLIQVGLPVPDSGDREFRKAVDAMRAEFPRFQRTEFKAGKPNESNDKVYAKFLKYVINLLGLVGDGSELRAVVTVEAAGRSAGSERDFILKAVTRAFENLKI